MWPETYVDKIYALFLLAHVLIIGYWLENENSTSYWIHFWVRRTDVLQRKAMGDSGTSPLIIHLN